MSAQNRSRSHAQPCVHRPGGVAGADLHTWGWQEPHRDRTSQFPKSCSFSLTFPCKNINLFFSRKFKPPPQWKGLLAVSSTQARLKVTRPSSPVLLVQADVSVTAPEPVFVPSYPQGGPAAGDPPTRCWSPGGAQGQPLIETGRTDWGLGCTCLKSRGKGTKTEAGLTERRDFIAPRSQHHLGSLALGRRCKVRGPDLHAHRGKAGRSSPERQVRGTTRDTGRGGPVYKPLPPTLNTVQLNPDAHRPGSRYRKSSSCLCVFICVHVT